MKNTSTIQYYNEPNCTISVSESVDRSRRGGRNMRLYVGTPWNPEELPNSTFKRPPYSRKGEDAAVDKLWKKYNKEELRLQQEAIQLAIDNGLIDSALVKNRKWSRKCGCSCGCSPGWLVRTGTFTYNPKSIWVTVTSARKEELRKQEQQEYVSKREVEAPTYAI